MYTAQELFSAIHREGPSSISGHPMWDLWWTTWYSDRFLSEYPIFSLVSIIRQFSISSFVVKPLLLSEGQSSSRYRPGVVQSVPGGLGSQIFMTSAHEGGEVVSLTHRPPLPPGMFLVLIFTRGWVDPRAMVWSEGNMSLKIPVTPPRIDPGNVRLVAQRLNHFAWRTSWRKFGTFQQNYTFSGV